MGGRPNIIDGKIDEVIRLYTKEGLSSEAIGKIFHVGKLSVTKLLRRNNIPVRSIGTRYLLNEDFFSSVDTPEKLWVLGWFYSDGYNSEEGNDVRITLNERDEEVLIKMAELMGSNRPIFKVPNLHTSSLIVSRRKISEDLAKLGCVQCKSLIIKYPQHLLSTRKKTCAFLRGVIEGDGCIYVNRKQGRQGPYVALTIACASPEFVYAIKEVFESNWNLYGCIQKTKERPIVGIRFTGSRLNMRRMLNEIYDLKTFGLYLERKYRKYLEAIEILDDMIKNHYHRRSRETVKPELDSGVYSDSLTTPPTVTPEPTYANG
jgi:hypothetical protein